MSPKAEMCEICFRQNQHKPSISKEELYEAVDQMNNYDAVSRFFNKDKDTIRRWLKYYAKQDRQNGIEVVIEGAPNREILKDEIRHYTFKEVGKKYGNVNANQVSKWCLRYDLPYKRDEIDNISDEDWVNI